MKSQDLQKINIPDLPGVYFFRDKQKVFYIGKATSLKDRIKSYFSSDLIDTRGKRIVEMVEKATTISFEVTGSVLEALILESKLIKKHQPFYNAKEKDNKSFNYVIFTNEDFPIIKIIRGKDLFDPEFKKQNKEPKYVFGPYPHGGMLKEGLRIIRKIFPFRDEFSCGTGARHKGYKHCFNFRLGLCPGLPGVDISKTQYNKTIRNLKYFFDGQKSILKKNLEKDMWNHAQKEEFEKADKIKKTIFALDHIKDVSLLKYTIDSADENKESDMRIESYDIAHLGGENTVGVMTVVIGGEIARKEYRLFNIRSQVKSSDIHALIEVLERRIAHNEWQLPKLIVVDGGLIQKNAISATLMKYGLAIPVVAVTKDEKHRPKEIKGDKKIIGLYGKDILLANHESHRFAITAHRKKRNKNFL